MSVHLCFLTRDAGLCPVTDTFADGLQDGRAMNSVRIVSRASELMPERVAFQQAKGMSFVNSALSNKWQIFLGE